MLLKYICSKTNQMIKSIAVFCGSSIGENPLYASHAKEIGCILAAKNIQLIYGGGRKGLMGTVADAVLEKKGKAIGVITEQLKYLEHMHENLTEIFIVPDMHARKK